MPRVATFKSKCASPWCVNSPAVGSHCSNGCKQKHQRIKMGTQKMPPLGKPLTPVTVIINTEGNYAIIQNHGQVEIREMTEEKTLELIEKLRPGKETIDGIVCKTTLESIPDIGIVEEDDWCKLEIEEGD